MNLQNFYGVLQQLATNLAAVYFSSSTTGANLTLSNSNQTVTNSSGSSQAVSSILNNALTSGSGKVYFEFKVVNYASASDTPYIGLLANNSSSYYSASIGGFGSYIKLALNGSGPAIIGTSSGYTVNMVNYSHTIATGDIIGMAVDITNGNVWMHCNGTWFSTSGGVGVPNTTTRPSFSGLSGTLYPAVTPYGNTSSIQVMGSGSQWSYQPPTGFIGLDGTQYNGSQTVYFDSANSCGLFNLSNNQRTAIWPNATNTNWFVTFLKNTITSGSYYVEFVVAGTQTVQSGEEIDIGLCDTRAFSYAGSGSYEIGSDPPFGNTASIYCNGGVGLLDNTTTGTVVRYVAGVGSTTWAPGNVIMMAVNISTGYIWFGYQGTWMTTIGGPNGIGVGNPSAGTYPSVTYSIPSLGSVPLYIGMSLSCNGSGNPIGATVQGSSSQWTYTRPTGFLGLDGS